MIDYRAFLGTTDIDKNGQIELPSAVREKFGFQLNQKFLVAGGRNKGSIILIKADTIDKLANLQLNHSKRFEMLAKNILAKSNLADTGVSFPNKRGVMEKEGLSEKLFDDQVLDLFNDDEFNAFLEEILG